MKFRSKSAASITEKSMGSTDQFLRPPPSFSAAPGNAGKNLPRSNSVAANVAPMRNRSLPKPTLTLPVISVGPTAACKPVIASC